MKSPRHYRFKSAPQLSLPQVNRPELNKHACRERCFRLLYIRALLQKEFTGDYLMISEAGMLAEEIRQLMARCSPVFLAHQFTAGSNEHLNLKAALVEQIREYLTTIPLYQSTN